LWSILRKTGLILPYNVNPSPTYNTSREATSDEVVELRKENMNDTREFGMYCSVNMNIYAS